MSKEMVVSFLLACALVSGAAWIAFKSDQSTQQKTFPAAVINAHPSSMSAPDSALSPEMKSSVAGHNGSSSHSRVVKCTMNGKIIYSDDKCPAGAKTQPVQLYDTAGIVSPPKEALSELTARRQASETTQIRSIQQPVAATARPKQAECDSLSKHIDWLDSMARQPQSGQMQDWIKHERRKARDRQFAMHC
jgi:hypothetical protein